MSWYLSFGFKVPFPVVIFVSVPGAVDCCVVRSLKVSCSATLEIGNKKSERQDIRI